MSNTQRERVYQLRVTGHLDSRWSDGFDGLVITLEDNGDSLLTGPVADQAALYGLLNKLRDLGLPLLAVNRLTPDQESDLKRSQKRGARSPSPREARGG